MGKGLWVQFSHRYSGEVGAHLKWSHFSLSVSELTRFCTLVVTLGRGRYLGWGASPFSSLPQPRVSYSPVSQVCQFWDSEYPFSSEEDLIRFDSLTKVRGSHFRRPLTSSR